MFCSAFEFRPAFDESATPCGKEVCVCACVSVCLSVCLSVWVSVFVAVAFFGSSKWSSRFCGGPLNELYLSITSLAFYANSIAHFMWCGAAVASVLTCIALLSSSWDAMLTAGVPLGQTRQLQGPGTRYPSGSSGLSANGSRAPVARLLGVRRPWHWQLQGLRCSLPGMLAGITQPGEGRRMRPSSWSGHCSRWRVRRAQRLPARAWRGL